jgi:hypothetical protein
MTGPPGSHRRWEASGITAGAVGWSWLDLEKS